MDTNRSTTMNYKYILSLLLIISGTAVFTACDDGVLEPIDELNFSRVMAPVGLQAFIRNQTTIELRWNLREGVDTYRVEFSEDSLEFNNIVFTDDVAADELPYQATFAGETRYSARVRAVGVEGLEDSKWTTITIATAPENIFVPWPGENVQDTYATLTWAPGSEVTHFIINPGGIERPITEDEKSAGEATIEDLSGATDYTITLYNGNKRRGTAAISTLREPTVFAGDDLQAVIASAPDGAELVLAPGTYTYSGMITLDKSITLIGQKPYDKPVLNVAFDIADGARDVTLENIELDGTGLDSRTLNLATAGIEYNSVNLEGCVIHDYSPQLIYGNVASKLGTFSVNNCIISDFVAGGGDFIDFRPGYVANVLLTNSTFDNCPSGRDFVRLDAAATFTGTGLTSNVLIDHCTIYGVSNTTDRLLYVRFDANILTVKNTIIAETSAYFSNQASTSQPVCSNNNYFNAPGFISGDISNAKYDDSGTHSTLDPGFVDAANGDFTVTNQDLIDAQVGDPRWRE